MFPVSSVILRGSVETAGNMRTPPEKVSFGYRTVNAEEKKKLVHDTFTPIAETYDRADALLSFGLQFLWKRAAVRRLGLGPGDEVLDVCGGTADLALRAAKRVGRSGRAVVYDFNRPMMEAGRLAALEFSLPRRRWQRSLYAFYSFRVMLPAARLITGTDGPFRYLAESIRVFDPPQGVAGRITAAGFTDVAFRPLTFGIAVIYFGLKPQEVPHAAGRR